MNLISALIGRKSTAGFGSTYGAHGTYALGSPYATIDRKDRAPGPMECIAQLVGTAHACANLNANAVASNPLRLFVRTGKGERRTRWATEPVGTKTLKRLVATKHVGNGFIASGGTVEEVKDHPLLSLLDIGDNAGKEEEEDDDGQPRLRGHLLFWCTQIYLEAIGRAYWLIQRDQLGKPVDIWLLRSHLVREWPDYENDGKIIKWYEYGGAAGRRYDPRDILRFSNPDPNLLYLGGFSPMQAAIEKIRLLRRDDAMLNAILQNMGYPGAILSPKPDDGGGGTVGPDVARRVRVAYDQMAQQAGAGGTITLPQAFDVHFPQWKPAEVIPFEKLQAIKTDICNVFGVPDALLNHNDANFASVKTANYSHAKNATLPRCGLISSGMRRLVRMYDGTGRLFLAYDNPVPDDEVFALEQMKAASASGAILRNEIRQSVDLEPMPWGDAPLIPKGMVSVDPKTGVPEAAADTSDQTDDSSGDDNTAEPTVRQRMISAGYNDDETAALIMKAQPATTHAGL